MFEFMFADNFILYLLLKKFRIPVSGLALVLFASPLPSVPPAATSCRNRKSILAMQNLLRRNHVVMISLPYHMADTGGIFSFHERHLPGG